MRRILLAVAVIALVAGCAFDESIRKEPIVSGKKIYVVKKGETIAQVADKLGVSLSSLKRANELELNRVTEGQRLIIPQGKSAKRDTALPSKKRVKKGKKKKFTPPKKAPVTATRLVWPIKNPIITSKFGIRGNGKHDGIDIGAPKGTKVVAAAGGTVIFSDWGPKGYGLIVVLKHSSELVTVYAHNSKNLVKKNQKVKKGAPIAIVGSTGRSTGTHVHFEVRVNRIPYNPLKYLPRLK